MEKDTYLLIGSPKFLILEKKLENYPTSKIKDGYGVVCSGPEAVVKDYIKKHNIPQSAIKTVLE